MLKRRALAATLWSAADVAVRQGLQVGLAILLARLLTPMDFGAMASLGLFVGVVTVLMDGGFSAALVQRRDIDATDESTVFWFNLFVGALGAVLLVAMAPHVARFYDLPILAQVMPVVALAVFISSAGAVHCTLLTRRLDFRDLMKINVSGALAAAVVAVAMAWRGFGVWSLVAQSVVSTCVTTCLFWWTDAWRPRWTFSRASANKLFNFGGFHLASSLLEMVYSRLYTLVVGRTFGAQDLGYYHNAETTRQMPGGFLVSVLARVALPMFAEAAHDRDKVRRGLQLALRATMLVNAPVMLGGAAVAEPLVHTLFGSQWLPAAPILRILCIASVFSPLHALNLHVLMAQGHSRLMFRLEVTKKSIGLALLVFGSLYGLLGMAWSQVAFSAIALLINTRYSVRFLDYGVAAQLRDVAPAVGVATVMAGAVAWMAWNWHWNVSSAVELFTLICIGAAVFFALVALLRAEALADVGLLLRRSRESRMNP